ncbi:MAG: deoxyribonuclease IV [Beduini sp.]|uniref:deoxyribonuclease IV n=1 Tax=Beduini sp. TaxID=1922300 RepID=UPI0011CBC1C7
MLIIGPHMFIAKGLAKAAQDVVDIKANTMQFFSRNPRGSNYKKYSQKEINDFQEIRIKNHFGPLLAHAPYTVNLASSNEKIFTFACNVIQEDIQRMQQLNIEMFVLHPGSHVGLGVEQGINNIIQGLNIIITGNEDIHILLETMSGKGTEVGYRFEHLKRILDGLEHPQKVGICLDLCHVYSAGYDIRNIDQILEEFDTILDLRRLKAIHLNDSLTPFHSLKDRHTYIGNGSIGLESILKVLTHPKLQHIPFYIETPLDNEGHKQEIAMIRKLIAEKHSS